MYPWKFRSRSCTFRISSDGGKDKGSYFIQLSKLWLTQYCLIVIRHQIKIGNDNELVLFLSPLISYSSETL